jgi:ABC-2 type transport system ATP-binding protein
MTEVVLSNVGVDIPIFDSSSRSLRTEALRLSIGGVFGRSVANALVVRALSDINLTLREGDRVGLLGHNGAGKSTMLRVIAGIYAPTSGTVSRKGRVATLFDATLGFNADASGYDNILISGLYHGMSMPEIKSKIDDIAAFSELGEFLHLPVRTYSMGMQARLSFSLATSVDPEILVLDEGINAGDASFTRKAEGRMRSLVDRSSILVLASHNLAFTKEWCNKAIVLEHGKILRAGPSDEIIDEYLEHVRTGEPLLPE